MGRPLKVSSRGSTSNGTKSHPCAYFIRFTDAENKDLVKLVRKRGLTMQAFAHAAIMRAFNEATLAKKSDGEIIRDNLEDRSRRKELPPGLGIRDRLIQGVEDRRQRYADEDDSPPPTTPALPPHLPPILPRAEDEVMAMARTIVEAPASTRRDVLKAAHRVLARGVIARGGSQEQALQLADDLDAAIRRLEGVPQSALERVRARMAR